MFYGITLYCVGRLHEESRFNEFASTYKTFGSLFLLGMAYIVVSEFATVRQTTGVTASAFLMAMSLAALATAALVYYQGRVDDEIEKVWYTGAFGISVLTVGIPWVLGDATGVVW